MVLRPMLRTINHPLGGDPPAGDRAFDADRPVPAGAEGLLVLPYFAGERTPIFDPHARGLLLGLTLSHGRAEIMRAIWYHLKREGISIPFPIRLVSRARSRSSVLKTTLPLCM